jgi:hypothetical protein
MTNMPPTKYIDEGIFLGTAESLNMPVCLSFKKLLSPTGLIIGKIRTGKSTSAKAILIRQHLQYGTNILIFDPHGEYVDLVKSVGGTVIDMKDEKINPCQLAKHLTNKEKAHQLVDMLGTVFQLNPIQRYHLTEYAKRGFDEFGDKLTFNHIIDTMTKESKRNTYLAKTIQAILVRIGIMTESVFGDANSIPIDNITRGIVCINLAKLDNNDLRNMAMLSVLQYIYNTMLANQTREEYEPDGNLRLLIMIDEAGRIASDESSAAVKLVKESGKFKIGLIFGIQDLPDLDPKIKSNYGFMIVHKLDDSEYISRIQKDGNFTKEQAERIRSLAVGAAYLKLNFKDASVQRPFIVRIEQEEHTRLISVSKDENQQDLDKISKIWGESEKKSEIRADAKSPKLDNLEKKEKPLSQDEQELVQSIAANPKLPITEHYEKIGVNVYNGNNAKKSLESKGYIKGRYLKGGVKGKIYYITEKGKRGLEVKTTTNRFGGPLHLGIIQKISDKLEELGYKVEREKMLGGGKHTDLVVNSTIAIEVETRELHESNVTKNLDAGFEKIIVVCFEPHIDKFNQKISGLGLNDKDRHRVVVLDQRMFSDSNAVQKIFGETKHDQ